MAIPTLSGVAFCKRWHMGYTCFEDCPRAASHIHPTGDIVDEVVAATAANIKAVVDVAMLVFGERIRISCLASVDQADRKP